MENWQNCITKAYRLTGMKIIEDICNGNLDPYSLTEHRHYNCKKPKEEITKALLGSNKEDYLFGLKQELKSYQFFQRNIKACDKQIKTFIKKELKQNLEKKKRKTTEKKYKQINKNAPQTKNMNQIAFRYFDGVDLLAIEGLSSASILSITSEIGPEGFKKFPTTKHLTSWLRLAPNNKISGGKVLSNQVPKGSNRLKIALR